MSNLTLPVAGLLFVVAAASAMAGAPKDVEGSKDYPMVGRYPGSIIEYYVSRQFDEFAFPIGAVVNGAPKSMHLEGKITRIIYSFPPDRSSLEVYLNHESALKRAGFVPVFTCSGDACGIGRFHMTSDWAVQTVTLIPKKWASAASVSVLFFRGNRLAIFAFS